MIKKVSLYAVILFIFNCMSSCSEELEYDGRVKLVYEGRVTDDAGVPLSDIPVNVYVSGEDDWEVISFTVTDSNGYYKMIFPRPTNEEDLSLQINQSNDDFVQRAAYSQTFLYNLHDENLTDYKILFDDIQLYRTTESVRLTLNFAGDGPAQLERAQLIGLVDNNQVNYNFTTFPGEGVDPIFENFSSAYFVRKNQLLTIKYMVFNPTMSQDYTIHETEIPIADEDLTVNINL